MLNSTDACQEVLFLRNVYLVFLQKGYIYILKKKDLILNEELSKDEKLNADSV